MDSSNQPFAPSALFKEVWSKIHEVFPRNIAIIRDDSLQEWLNPHQDSRIGEKNVVKLSLVIVWSQ